MYPNSLLIGLPFYSLRGVQWALLPLWHWAWRRRNVTPWTTIILCTACWQWYCTFRLLNVKQTMKTVSQSAQNSRLIFLPTGKGLKIKDTCHGWWRNWLGSCRYDLLCEEGISRALRIFEGKMAAPNYRLVKPANGQLEKIIVKPEVSLIHLSLSNERNTNGYWMIDCSNQTQHCWCYLAQYYLHWRTLSELHWSSGQASQQHLPVRIDWRI